MTTLTQAVRQETENMAANCTSVLANNATTHAAGHNFVDTLTDAANSWNYTGLVIFICIWEAWSFFSSLRHIVTAKLEVGAE
jgi:hypothetical protein